MFDLTAAKYTLDLSTTGSNVKEASKKSELSVKVLFRVPHECSSLNHNKEDESSRANESIFRLAGLRSKVSCSLWVRL